MSLAFHSCNSFWCILSKGSSHLKVTKCWIYCPLSPIMVSVHQVDNEICSNIMWSFSSLFPSPGLSDLNGRSGVTKAQGQALLHKLPIQLTVCKCSTGRLQEGQPFWQVSFLIYQTVKPSTQVPAVTVCFLMLRCKSCRNHSCSLTRHNTQNWF